jgi:hypothetical protein
MGQASESGAEPVNFSPATIRMSQPTFDLLRQVIGERALELLHMFHEGCLVMVEEHRKRNIQEPLGDQFAETGLQGSFEPNERGIAREKLIDIFSPYK